MNEIKIDDTIYTEEDVKKWASELEVDENGLLDVLEDWDDTDWVLFHHLGADSSLFDGLCHLKDTDYLILTDGEADERFRESLEDLVDEDVPSWLRCYFDIDALMRDSDRGQTLAGYDGVEHEYDLNGTTYYLYRVN